MENNKGWEGSRNWTLKQSNRNPPPKKNFVKAPFTRGKMDYDIANKTV